MLSNLGLLKHYIVPKNGAVHFLILRHKMICGLDIRIFADHFSLDLRIHMLCLIWVS